MENPVLSSHGPSAIASFPIFSLRMNNAGDSSRTTLDSETNKRPPAGPSRRIGSLAIVPGLVTVIISWGLATALLAWLFSRRITEHPPNEDHFFQGALVAVERGVAPVHDVDGTVVAQSKLYGLTISSLTSTVVQATIPVIFSLFAFLVAADWLNAQNAGRTNALPTPPQYGMMVHMFGSTSIKTVYDYWTFFRRPTPAIAQPVGTLKKCFTVLLILVAFNYAIVFVPAPWMARSSRHSR
ncbi:hypothetical protein B0H19DRAFT_492668 [Mycena capillaripes]|nr:hypothetical protein B0H19DRAFT_492668 [Mycena capillaripes]